MTNCRIPCEHGSYTRHHYLLDWRDDTGNLTGVSCPGGSPVTAADLVSELRKLGYQVSDQAIQSAAT